MPAIMGKDGKIDIGAVEAGLIDSWSASISADIVDITSFGDKAKKGEYGLTSCTGSASGTRDVTDPAQEAIIAMFFDVDTGTPTTPGTKTEAEQVKVQLTLVCTNGYVYHGTFLISSLELGATVGDKQSFSFNFQADGKVTVYKGV